jgi:hypothetical protein
MVTIRSEEDAWQALEKLINKENVGPIVFDGWPVFNLTVKGDEWDGTIPTRLLQPLIEFQRNINRIYSYSINKTDNIRILSEQEREELELTVKVEHGSSSFEILLYDKLTKIVETGVDHMTGPETLIFLIVATLAIAGVFLFKAWLSHKENLDLSNNTLESSKEETRRTEIIYRITKDRDAVFEKVIDSILENERDFIKSIKDADSAKLNGLQFNRCSIEKLSRYKISKHRKEQIEGEFIVTENKSRYSDEYRLKLNNISDNTTITAILPKNIEQNKKDIIMRSEWENRPVFMRLEITYKNNIFESAKIIDVRPSVGE